MSDRPFRAPRWAEVSTFILSCVGLGLSIYLTIAHYEGTSFLACPTGNSHIDCAKVTTSAESHFLGIPVALLGLATYVVMVGINSPWAWRARARWVHVTRFVLVAGSMCFVVWLIYAEVILIDAICIYCTAVHATTLTLLIILTIVSPVQLGWTSSRTNESAPLELV